MQWNDTKELGANALGKIKENNDFLRMEILAGESETELGHVAMFLGRNRISIGFILG